MKQTVSLITALGFLAAAPLAAQQSELPAPTARQPSIMVQASGEASAEPDTMTISTGVESTGTTAAAALDANNHAMQNLVDAIRAAGITPENIKTSRLSVTPEYRDRQRREGDVEIIGYRASNRLTVMLTDLERAERVVSAFFEAGANTIDGPSFTIEDDAARRRLAAAAEREAIANARAKAENMASALGMRVGMPLRVADRSLDAGPYRSAEVITVTGSRIANTPLEPGEITVSANVYIEFAMEPR
ncbi:SIMPL domain-containing protein [Qipengyuania atrilutea]|uniref:SIMPL domain-containing protein n=1 Tax=Qipengyuania atrilutea TaxID=2744473 RepID=A0A850GZS8_9SPHN|nr:SIMPL domain-containing protein [Actirhodobacter atriluteus]NVD43986.1 SIMPL domain-containing protein [Actirhodobacter atriluteus]